MAFKLKDRNYTVKWPVSVEVPVNGGKKNIETFDAEFKVLPKDELKDLMDSGVSDDDLIEKVVVGYSGIKDENGNEIPFSAENLKEVCRFSFVTTAIVVAYLEMVAKRKTKN